MWSVARVGLARGCVPRAALLCPARVPIAAPRTLAWAPRAPVRALHNSPLLAKQAPPEDARRAPLPTDAKRAGAGAPDAREPGTVSHILATLRDMARSRRAGAQGSVGAQFPALGRLYSLMLPEYRGMLIAMGLLLVASAVSLSVPFTIGKVVDFFSSPDATLPFGLSMSTVAVLLLAVFALGAVARASSNILLELAGVRVIQRMREKTFHSAIRQDVAYADRGVGDTVSRINMDCNLVGEAITTDLADGLRSTVTVLAAGSAMFYISSKLTLVMMCVIPPAALGAAFYGRFLRNLTNRTQEAVGEMTRTAEERLNPPAFRTIAAFNTQERESRRFDEKVRDIVQLQTKEAYAGGIFHSGLGFVGNCAIVTLLTYGGHLVSLGQLTVGDLTSLLMYTAYLGGGVMLMTSFFTSLMKGVGAGARVFQLLDRKPAIELGQGQRLDVPAIDRRGGHIHFDNVHFTYPSRPDMPILNGVSLDIKPGSSVALVGGSGAGKSSVHALLLRFYEPTSGTVSFDGQDVRSVEPESLRSFMGVVSQEPTLFEGTIAENIAYGTPGATRQQIERAARQAHCIEFIDTMPHGFETRIGPRELSGGQRQRIAIARALVREPSVLVRAPTHPAPRRGDLCAGQRVRAPREPGDHVDHQRGHRHRVDRRPPPQHDPRRKHHHAPARRQDRRGGLLRGARPARHRVPRADVEPAAGVGALAGVRGRQRPECA